jgi:uncharacterized protein
MTILRPFSFISSAVRQTLIQEKNGQGVVAAIHVPAGHVLATWGGTVITGEQARSLSQADSRSLVQIEEDLFLYTPPDRLGPADSINHSCDPNAGIHGQITLVALREIEEGEEICYDYAMTDGEPYDEFICRCGSPGCRGRVTGDDWRRPELWARYHYHFSPYLVRRIRNLQIVEPRTNGFG